MACSYQKDMDKNKSRLSCARFFGPVTRSDTKNKKKKEKHR